MDRFLPSKALQEQQKTALSSYLCLFFSKRRGFTLLELLFVIAIIGILTSIAIPMYKSYIESSRVKEVIFEIKGLELDINMFRLDNDRFPSSLAELDKGVLMDPWGYPYKYLNIADDNPSTGKMRKDGSMVPINTDYDLYSIGPDGKTASPLTSENSHDDIVRANDGGYVGLGSSY